MERNSDLSILNHLLKLDIDLTHCESDRSKLLHEITEVLRQLESDGLLDEAIRQIVKFLGVDHLLPKNYAKFQPLLIEGMVFLLGRLPISRLAEKIADQIQLPVHSSKGHRICVLISDMPSLQKLGQVICRSPGLEPEFKQALIELEDQVKTISFDALVPYIKKEIETIDPEYRFELEECILAEASVCAVVGAKVRHKKRGASEAVLKMVKPSVRDNLAQELELFDELAEFLDQNRSQWGLGQFQFRNTFKQVRWLLENEINLGVEQDNLLTARDYYKSFSDLVVPFRFPCSTPVMTVMSREKGYKITDVAHLNKLQKRRLVSALVNFCILRPIQDVGAVSLFHGDPHAGNIAYTFEGKNPRIVLYDWGMMGRLNRIERFSLLLIAFGIIFKSHVSILFGVDLITKRQILSEGGLESDLYDVVEEILIQRDGRIEGLLSSIEQLLEALSYQGIVFPDHFLMFEKTLITLKGVMAEIDPDFNRDDYLFWGALNCLYRDLFRFGFYRTVIKEACSSYRYGFKTLMEIQKSFIRSTPQMLFSKNSG